MIPARQQLVADAIRRGPQAGEMCLSVRQPFAWLLVGGYKPVENRSWTTQHRGLLWIHASQAAEREDVSQEWMRTSGGMEEADVARYKLVQSAVLGAVWLEEVYDKLPPFLTGNLHAEKSAFWWWMSAAAPLKRPLPMSGKLRLWPYP